MDEELLREAVQWVTRIVEILGILIILIGAVIALARFALGSDKREGQDRIRACVPTRAARSYSAWNSRRRRTSSTPSRSSRRWTA
jgi:hypothetical protein